MSRAQDISVTGFDDTAAITPPCRRRIAHNSTRCTIPKSHTDSKHDEAAIGSEGTSKAIDTISSFEHQHAFSGLSEYVHPMLASRPDRKNSIGQKNQMRLQSCQADAANAHTARPTEDWLSADFIGDPPVTPPLDTKTNDCQQQRD